MEYHVLAQKHVEIKLVPDDPAFMLYMDDATQDSYFLTSQGETRWTRTLFAPIVCKVAGLNEGVKLRLPVRDDKGAITGWRIPIPIEEYTRLHDKADLPVQFSSLTAKLRYICYRVGVGAPVGPH